MTFVPTPFAFLITSREFPTDNAQYLEDVLSKMYVDIQNAVNLREIALYDKAQVTTGQVWFSEGDQPYNRLQGFRQCYTFNSIQNGSNVIAHNIPIDKNTQFTKIIGTANNPNTKFVPLPYVDGTGGGDNIGLYVDDTNIYIVTSTANWTSFNAIVILEYILFN